jgi:hypothetical protein
VDEVREIHSLHGEFDVIARMSLVRHLLTFHGDTIGQLLRNRKYRHLAMTTSFPRPICVLDIILLSPV